MNTASFSQWISRIAWMARGLAFFTGAVVLPGWPHEIAVSKTGWPERLPLTASALVLDSVDSAKRERETAEINNVATAL